VGPGDPGLRGAAPASLIDPVAGVDASAAPALRRLLRWRSACVIALGSPLLVTVSFGPMAAEIGTASLLVWTATGFVGLVQCLLIAELASRFPHRAGGAPAYAHEGLKHVSPLFGAAAAWSYWVGWIPGIAINLTLAAAYLRAAFWPGANVLAVTLALVGILYALNRLGLRCSAWLAGVMASCALIPLLLILAAPLVRTGAWHWANFTPLLPHRGSAPPSTTAGLLLKWAFVAAWSAYGAEMVATMTGELRDPWRDIPRAIGLTAVATLGAFALIPTLLVGTVGSAGLAEDPYVVFLTAARATLGRIGAQVVAVMLVGSLILSAQLFLISSSRALHQMSRDGLSLRIYSAVNRHGAPSGSMAWDLLLTLSLLAVFRDDVVDVVASANVGYLLVFVLVPLAFILVRRRDTAERPWFLLRPFPVAVAWAVLAFNLVLLVFGGLQWGLGVMALGLLLVLSFLPCHVLARLRRRH
jgi:amino acid transporter